MGGGIDSSALDHLDDRFIQNFDFVGLRRQRSLAAGFVVLSEDSKLVFELFDLLFEA